MICALLNFYDEDPAWLDRAIRSAAGAVGVKTLVALDGRYAHYPGTAARSSPVEYAAIRAAAAKAGLELVIEGLGEAWPDQPAKRSRLFALGEEITGPNDWYLVLDADAELVGDPGEVADRIASTRLDAAEVLLVEEHRGREQPFRALFRAVRGLRAVGNHYTYATPDGRRLWGHGDGLEPALDLTGSLRLIHHTAARPVERRDAQAAYYRARNLSGVERGPCGRCGQPSACMMLDGFRRENRDKVSTGYVEVCAACVPWYARRNALTAKRVGIDPVWAARPRNTVEGFRKLVEDAVGEDRARPFLPILGR